MVHTEEHVAWCEAGKRKSCWFLNAPLASVVPPPSSGQVSASELVSKEDLLEATMDMAAAVIV